MEVATKFLCLVGFLILISNAKVESGGECGSSTADDEALKLFPCIKAAQDVNVIVSESCCTEVKNAGQNPACLCATMFSNNARSAGISPEVAITIPKRCNLNRPVGYKCGPYTIP